MKRLLVIILSLPFLVVFAAMQAMVLMFLVFALPIWTLMATISWLNGNRFDLSIVAEVIAMPYQMYMEIFRI
jgi:hypothetical protein